jgi:hypothetical protein
METFGIIMMITGAVAILMAFGLLFSVALLYAIITYVERKE